MRPRRPLLAAALATPFLPGAALAQAEWPSRPIRLIVPFPPGGASDLLGRLMAEGLTAQLRQPVVVENRGGAGGLTAAEYASKQPGDGYTLLLGTQPTQVFNKYLYAHLPYDPDRDFTPVSTVAAVAYVLVVNPNVPAKDLPELIAYARANPGRLNYGSSGTGGGMHLATHLFAERAGGNMVHVPYRGAAPAVTALVQGEVQLMVDLVPNSLPLIRSGALKAFAVGLPEPSPLLPGVPTFRGFGITDFDVPSWFVLVASGQVPPAVEERLRAAAEATVADPGFATRLEAVSARPLPISGPALRAFLAEQSARWEPIIRSANVRLD
ncbi:Bug family tripartite tricarboxylate transporter substrate binding protein [Pararoseomonas indoligenes]|uniref:Tripartite tricarboxylate transporter substrate binding protein n=1 Tax=Roseomonas indoligenes TaxID=2820811 RepID=A0A940S631_9PROT|nr:tripartite tricarboxylate transporter substrate binding protein [Pararoseomonas indoligenes]MBP0495071.1 tripartite tricarboxylate transporter substrate binding protein [Pararoseomonas indoligenes]